MKILTVFIVVLCPYLALSQEDAAYEGRIIGGEDAANGSAPYQISLKNVFDNEHFCGGSILNKRWILTAGHCLEGIAASDITVYAGSNDLEDPHGQGYTVEKLIIHEHFQQDDNPCNDIGLVKVNKDIVFSENAKPVKISKKRVDEEEVLKATGWGTVTRYGDPVRFMQELYTKAITDEECQKRIDIVICQHLCVAAGYKGVCFGDSGGPLVNKDGELVGVTSFTLDSCASGFPDIFTRLSDYIDWIDNKIKNN